MQDLGPFSDDSGLHSLSSPSSPLETFEVSFFLLEQGFGSEAFSLIFVANIADAAQITMTIPTLYFSLHSTKA